MSEPNTLTNAPAAAGNAPGIGATDATPPTNPGVGQDPAATPPAEDKNKEPEKPRKDDKANKAKAGRPKKSTPLDVVVGQIRGAQHVVDELEASGTGASKLVPAREMIASMSLERDRLGGDHDKPVEKTHLLDGAGMCVDVLRDSGASDGTMKKAEKFANELA